MRKGLIAALFTTLLTACAGISPVPDQAIRFNQNYADASNKVFLLNTIRAAKHLPLYYTRVTGITSEGLAQAKLGLPFEIGPHSTEIFKISPELSESQKDAVQIAVLDDQKFMNGVLTPIPDATLKFYFDQGWTPELLLMLSIEHIKIGKTALAKVKAGLENVCPSFKDNAYCANAKAIAGALAGCGENISADTHLFDNNPRGKGDDIRCFQALLRGLLAAGMTVEQRDDLTPVNTQLSAESASHLQHVLAAAKDSYDVKITDKVGTLSKKTSKLNFKFPRFQGLRLNTATTASKLEGEESAAGESAADQIAFIPRSPDAMIFYLGEITRARLDGKPEDRHTVTIWSVEKATYKEHALYVVNEGTPAGRTAVEITDDGRTYSIPETCFMNGDDCKAHRSMQAIAFVNQVFGMLREATTAPAIPSITVIPN